ncbi:SDR family oxidoreductase [Bacteriovorax sp. PP10]|uniref:SDR family oxidoreductase n=1 Tax=Bacteriovorax antarcticus TaxID=3088717 RepID=A0ABU5VYZ6_9BACT|nr:SDR family oxidoreductase [Bacteriovorax sp. PP10]MEA9358293.1 SDR family oxidoreductase [Bacteriovorax sp. PP10]
MNILITGATGFLGGYLIRELAAQYENIYVVSRKEQLSKFTEFPNVKCIKGDITSLDVISLEGSEKIKLLDSIDVVLHAAALYDLSASYSDCFLQNVVGTQNMLHLLKGMKNLKAFYYVSTIAVGDPEVYFLDENQLPKRNNFGDSYSETKYLAEQVVRDNVNERFVTRIIRPGIIIGDSVTLEMEKIDGPYYFLEAFKKYSHLLKYTPIVPLSFNPRSKLPIIPVDHCAHFIKLLIERDNHKVNLKTYHLVSSEIPTLMEFLRDLNKKFGVKTHYFPVKENRIHNSLLKLLGIPEEVLPFMFSRISYDKTSTLEDLPEINESTYSTFKSILFGKS